MNWSINQSIDQLCSSIKCLQATEESQVALAVRTHRTLELAGDNFYVITCGRRWIFGGNNLMEIIWWKLFDGNNLMEIIWWYRACWRQLLCHNMHSHVNNWCKLLWWCWPIPHWYFGKTFPLSLVFLNIIAGDDKRPSVVSVSVNLSLEI